MSLPAMGVSRRDLSFGVAGLVGASVGYASPAAASADEAQIPFLVTRNHVWTAVRLENKGPFPFLIDTGATWFFVDPDLAAQLGLQPTGAKEKVHTAAGLTWESIYHLGRISVANQMEEDNTRIVALREDRNDITKGLIPLSDKLTAGFDFDRKVMNVWRNLGRIPDGYQQLDLLNARGWSGDMVAVDLPGEEVGSDNGLDATHTRRKLLTRQPIVTAELDGRPIRLMIDTGEAEGLLIFPSYVRTEKLWDHYPRFQPSVSHALDRDVKTRLVRPQSLAFGGVKFDRPIVALADPKSSGNAYGLADGVVGVEILRRLNFIIDPSRRVAAFKANSAFTDVWRHDRAGLSIERVGAKIQITQVAEGGPAWKSGLREGDVVTGWAGGEPAPGANPYFGLLWALQGKPGDRLGIQIEGGAKSELVGVTLEDLI